MIPPLHDLRKGVKTHDVLIRCWVTMLWAAVCFNIRMSTNVVDVVPENFPDLGPPPAIETKVWNFRFFAA